MKKNKVTITIDNIKITTKPNQTILEVARKHNIMIPTLCKHPLLGPVGACRMCIAEVKGVRRLLATCSTPIADGMEILTHSPRVQKTRRIILELLLANHNCYCPTCVMNKKCALQDYCKIYNVLVVPYIGELRKSSHDYQGVIQREQSKCILCGQCVAVCRDLQADYAIDFYGRGFQTNVGTPYDIPLKNTACMNCGQCVIACPTGALKTRQDTEIILNLLSDPSNYLVAQIAPSVRVTLGEEFGLKPGTIVTGKIINALKKLGFKKVLDTNLGADLTILEEAHEFLERLLTGKNLPLITSCCPGWVKYAEHFFQSLLKNLSSCKSPQLMCGAINKWYFGPQERLKPKNIINVAIMPCCAKKFENERPEMQNSKIKDVDYVLTTRELADLIKQANIDFNSLSSQSFDDKNNETTGAGQIFGATGGVTEAMLRTVTEKITGEKLKKIDFTEVRGIYEGVKTVNLHLTKTNKKYRKISSLNIAVVHGMANAREILEEVRKGNPKKFHIIEIMACPGGCINGGGQPFYKNFEVVEKRKQAIYKADKEKKYRQSHQNPLIKKIYKDFLGKPLSKKAHQYLHTKFVRRTLLNQEENLNT